jgi:hypothetical protein
MRRTVFISCFAALFIIFAVLLIVTCGDGGGRRQKPPSDEEVVSGTLNTNTTIPVIKPVINVYIENSGSMDGYMSGNYEFKDAISSLLAKLPYHYDEKNIKIHFINSKIDSVSTIQADLTNFSKELNMYWEKSKRTRSSSTNLNNIFQDILNQTDSATISILFSDCIYSIGKGDVIGLLNFEKNLTMGAFLQKYKKDKISLTTTILKMKSHFKGKYFPYTGDQNHFQIDMERPYYICVIGSNDVMRNFNDKISLEKGKIDGFDNKYIIQAGATKDIYYSVLLSTDNVGRFKATRSLSTDKYVHGIEDINMKSRNRDGTGSNKLTFAVAVDLKDIPVEEDYLLNPDNYALGDDNFTVKQVKPVNKNDISASDWVRISHTNNPTHLLILEASGTAMSNVKVSLKKQMPQWINDTTTEDDTDKSKLIGKTFGLKYWVEGIATAYQTIYPDDKYFFEIEIKIKN